MINPRDFPVNNVPLFYPAFLLFAVFIGSRNMLEGFRRTKFLSILLIVYWSYYRILILINGGTIGIGNIAYLLEPLLIFGVAGTAAIKPGGTKAALWALVFTITLSTVCGIWIFFIGEPVLSWRTAIHSSIGGNLLQGEFTRDIDLRIDQALIVVRNTGLSYKIFIFSYQLAVAIAMTLVGFFSLRGHLNLKKLLLVGVLLILIVGMITNTQRATLVSSSAGFLSFFLISKEKIISTKMFLGFLIIISVIVGIVYYPSSNWGGYTLFERSFQKEEISVRASMAIPAIKSILFEPLGAGGLSDYYRDIAFTKGWAVGSNVRSAHNHFASVVMYTGIVGIFVILSLFSRLLKKLKFIRSSALGDDVKILFIGCITLIIHSLTHNAGFFAGERATYIVFGLLWSATPVIKHTISNHKIAKKALYSK